MSLTSEQEDALSQIAEHWPGKRGEGPLAGYYFEWDFGARYFVRVCDGAGMMIRRKSDGDPVFDPMTSVDVMHAHPEVQAAYARKKWRGGAGLRFYGLALRGETERADALGDRIFGQ